MPKNKSPMELLAEGKCGSSSPCMQGSKAFSDMCWSCRAKACCDDSLSMQPYEAIILGEYAALNAKVTELELEVSTLEGLLNPK